MKELTKDFKDSVIEIQVEKQVLKEIKLIGRQRKILGLTLWEFNVKTKILLPAQYKKEDIKMISLSQRPEKHNKVVVNENCVYFQALNRKSAIKKLNKNETRITE